MKKLYIPTSSLNFNNILSSESISPKAFYGQRSFGIQRWTEIPENGIANAILLYESPFQFTILPSEIENHPMLVEIWISEDLPQVAPGIYYSDHTIYLSPWRTRIIFFSDQERQIAFSMSDSGLETKLVNLYRKKIVVERFESLDIEIPDNANICLNEKSIEQDCIINKMKGMLYGYYIGGMLSVSKSNLQRCNILREMAEIFTSVESSVEHIPAAIQQRRWNELSDQWMWQMPCCVKLSSMLKDGYSISEIWNMGWRHADIERIIRIRTSLSDISNEKERIERWLQDELWKVEDEAKREMNPVNDMDGEILTIERRIESISSTVVSDIQEVEIVKAWMNEVLIQTHFDRHISISREALSDAITLVVKDKVLGNAWNESPIRTTLNDMRHMIRAEENNFKWDNKLFSSIAAVLLRGDDWNNLLRFMQRKGLNDYRLPFAFYGELHGFADLTRDFTDTFFDYEDRGYVAKVYKEIYGQIYDEDPTLKAGTNTNDIDSVNEIFPSIDFEKCSNTDNEGNMVYEVRETVLSCLSSIKKINKDLEKVVEETLEKKSVSLKDFCDKLLQDQRSVTKKNETKSAFKKFVNQLCPDYIWGKKDFISLKVRKTRDDVLYGQMDMFTSQSKMINEKTSKKTLPDIPSLRQFKGTPIYRRLEENWSHTVRCEVEKNGKEYMCDDQLRYFVNLCAKDGRGENKNWGKDWFIRHFE